MADYDIEDWEDAADMSLDLSGDYTILNDLLTTTVGYAAYAGPAANGGLGWEPISTFNGKFDGGGYTIEDLHINRPSAIGVGLFGASSSLSAEINNLILVNPTINGLERVGSLCGDFAFGSINKVLVLNPSITCSATSGSFSYTGGFIGKVSGTITNCAVIGGSVVSLGAYIGGFVGRGSSAPAPTIADSYSSASVSGEYNVGGFMGGKSETYGVRTYRCYSTGYVSGVSSVGGFVGDSNANQHTNSFWDTETSGQATSDGGTGKTTAEMQTESTFTSAGWDFATIWGINPSGYPHLQWTITTILELLENMHDGADGLKCEYNVTEGAYRITHGSENIEFTQDRTLVKRRIYTYNPTTKLLSLYINGALLGTHTFTNALAMPAAGDYTIEGVRTIDEFSIEEGDVAAGDVVTDYSFFS